MSSNVEITSSTFQPGTESHMLVSFLADPDLRIGAVFVVPFAHVCRILDQFDAVLLTLTVRLAGIPEPEVQNDTRKGEVTIVLPLLHSYSKVACTAVVAAFFCFLNFESKPEHPVPSDLLCAAS